MANWRYRKTNTLEKSKKTASPVSFAGTEREGISVTNTSGMWGTLEKEIITEESHSVSHDGRDDNGTYFRWMVKFSGNAKRTRFNKKTMHLTEVERRQEPRNQGDLVLVTSASKNMARRHLGQTGKILKINNEKVFVKLQNGENLSCNMKHVHLLEETSEHHDQEERETAAAVVCHRGCYSKDIQRMTEIMRPYEVLEKVKYF